jgi:hypothetical protein
MNGATGRASGWGIARVAVMGAWENENGDLGVKSEVAVPGPEDKLRATPAAVPISSRGAVFRPGPAGRRGPAGG